MHAAINVNEIPIWPTFDPHSLRVGFSIDLMLAPVLASAAWVFVPVNELLLEFTCCAINIKSITTTIGSLTHGS